MSNTIRDFFDFVKASPTAFHAVQELCSMLDAAGFTALNEYVPFEIARGGKYYVTRNMSAVIAFTVPEEGFTPCRIVASHSDSPLFRLKPISEETVCAHYTRLNTEKYGGMLMSTWFDRPLSVAGRIVIRRNGKLVSKIVDLGCDAAIIPNMPIHFNRDANDGYKYNAQVDLLPIIGDASAKGKLMTRLAGKAGAAVSDVVASDLFLYTRSEGSVWGMEDEFLSCPRIDDLECAYTSMKALIDASAGSQIDMCAVFDNEEVGSGTKQGADSTFLDDTITRIGLALGADASAIRAAIAGSFMVSADNAHAVHPNHTEKYDADNRAFMNEGIVIKVNANQKYTTDAVSVAVFSEICAKAGVPVQYLANRSDIAGGSTLGNIANRHDSMNTVDIGLAQLAMHSAYETAGSRDVDFMVRALTAFYSTEIRIESDGTIAVG